MNSNLCKEVILAGLLISIGTVYGDIDTSPPYVMKAIINENGGVAHVSREHTADSILFILWTITLLTAVKYVLIALKATNHDEDGIFSLYVLIREKAKWLAIPTLAEGTTLLADSTLTPVITVTAAIEGPKNMKFGNDTPVPN